jgi:hypothetical protein
MLMEPKTLLAENQKQITKQRIIDLFDTVFVETNKIQLQQHYGASVSNQS